LKTSDTQSKFQQSLLISESEFVKISPTSSIIRTPSPKYIQSINDDQNSTNRYSNYDNRPIKPLDQNMLQSKLNQYPIENIDTNNSRSRISTNSKRTSTHLAYNANRYSPKTTPRELTTSKSNKNQAKRHTIAADDANTLHLLSTVKIKNKQQSTNDDEEEFQLKSAPVNPIRSTQSATTHSVELKKITTSIQTMRTSVLQA